MNIFRIHDGADIQFVTVGHPVMAALPEIQNLGQKDRNRILSEAAAVATTWPGPVWCDDTVMTIKIITLSVIFTVTCPYLLHSPNIKYWPFAYAHFTCKFYVAICTS